MIETKYDREESCNKCGGLNNRVKNGKFYAEHEFETICDECGHIDFWAYGYFQSGCDGLNKAKKYVNRKGKIVNI